MCYTWVWALLAFYVACYSVLNVSIVYVPEGFHMFGFLL